jgi:hypothetical protein
MWHSLPLPARGEREQSAGDDPEGCQAMRAILNAAVTAWSEIRKKR